MGFVAEKDTQRLPVPVTGVSSGPNSRKSRNPKTASEPDLEVSITALDGETLRGLIDEWLIQAMVNRYINERLEAARQEHNTRQP